jgi:hypothetical protein
MLEEATVKLPVVVNPTEPVPDSSSAFAAKLEVPDIEPVTATLPETDKFPFTVREPVMTGKY